MGGAVEFLDRGDGGVAVEDLVGRLGTGFPRDHLGVLLEDFGGGEDET